MLSIKFELNVISKKKATRRWLSNLVKSGYAFL
jgi:hypothetical protein